MHEKSKPEFFEKTDLLEVVAELRILGRSELIPHQPAARGEPWAARKETRTMMPERIGIELRNLPNWQPFLTPTSQTLQRTVEFPTHADAQRVADILGDLDEPCAPRIVVQPGGTAELPAGMTITLSVPSLETEHFTLARFIDATLAVLMPESGDSVDGPSSTEVA